MRASSPFSNLMACRLFLFCYYVWHSVEGVILTCHHFRYSKLSPTRRLSTHSTSPLNVRCSSAVSPLTGDSERNASDPDTDSYTVATIPCLHASSVPQRLFPQFPSRSCSRSHSRSRSRFQPTTASGPGPPNPSQRVNRMRKIHEPELLHTTLHHYYLPS
ncbi:hypothetical protein BGW80DRAFT_1366122 [Lactifluus volemus]|nr:hypothetical protein BGW80DRAFT_1366122 [Lactifluus volemus]